MKPFPNNSAAPTVGRAMPAGFSPTMALTAGTARPTGK